MTQKFGWVPHKKRSSQTKKLCAKIIGDMPKFAIRGAEPTITRRVLWDYSLALLGKHLPCLEQQTGSCVGNGAWTAMMYLQAAEIVRVGDDETMKPLFLPYHYGRGRYHAGIHGRGDGSTGAGQAEAILKDGVIVQQDGLPEPTGGDDAFTWGESAEMKWSDGAKIDSKWIKEGRLHLVKSAALLNSADDCAKAILNGFPVTVASDVGFEGKKERYKDKVVLRRGGSWAHQMAVLAVDLDEDRPLFYIQNSWAADWQPDCPDGAPPGGFWVDYDTVDAMMKQDDSFAFSQFDGFPANADDVDWMPV